ncbi:MAG: DUF3253 domain-containing protein [Sphingomonadaceae bacterium]
MAPALSPEAAIRAALARRRAGATICPTDAARLMGADWRTHLAVVHAAARQMAAAGEVLLTERGVGVARPTGAYRIGWARDPG